MACTKLAKVHVGADVRTIGYRAFADCTELQEINLTDRITTFGDYYGTSETFRGCINLDNIVLGKRISAMGTKVFVNCTGLTTVTVNNGCELIGEACFYGCAKLSGIDLPESVISIGAEAFYGCSAMITAIIGDGVTSIGHNAFQNCSSLATVSLGDGLKTIGYRAFKGCASLTGIVIPDYVTSLTDYYGTSETFNGCTALVNVTLGKRINSMGSSVFGNCPNIEYITIKDGCSVVGEKCFNGCDKIKYIHNNCTEIPTTSSNAFSSYTATLYVPAESLDAYKVHEVWGQFFAVLDITTSGIADISTDDSTNGVAGYYDLSGRHSSTSHHGITIIRLKNGTVRKVMIK